MYCSIPVQKSKPPPLKKACESGTLGCLWKVWTVWKKVVDFWAVLARVCFKTQNASAWIVDENKNYPHPFWQKIAKKIVDSVDN